MGVWKPGFSSRCGCGQSVVGYVSPVRETVKVIVQQPTLPNPDPSRFLVLRTEECGRFLVALVEYPNCTNYEGKKIMVFQDTDEAVLRTAKRLDPHFCDGDHLSPLARFEPTERGWRLAVAFAKLAESVG